MELTEEEIAKLPRFKVGLSPGFGLGSSPEIPRTGFDNSFPFTPTEVNVLELIKYVSPGGIEGAQCGGAFSHSTFKLGPHPDGKYLDKGRQYFRHSRAVKSCQCTIVDIDAKGFSQEEIKTFFPTIDEFISKTRIGPAVAAVLPSKSLDKNITDTVVAHLLIVWEHALGSSIAIENLSKGIELSIVADIPELAEKVVLEKAGKRGGIDKKATENTAGFWYGLRADQKPMYVNPSAVLNGALMNELQALGAAELDSKRRFNPGQGAAFGNSKRQVTKGQAFIDGDANIGDDNEYLTSQIVAEVTWLFENILPPPGPGTYNEFFCDIKQFCCNHVETFGDLFIEYVHTDTTGYRIQKYGSPEQQLASGNWSYAPSWKPLIRALNAVDPDWPFKFYEANGYHTSIDWKAPNQLTAFTSRQRYYDCLLTGTHHYQIIVPDEEA